MILLDGGVNGLYTAYLVKVIGGLFLFVSVTFFFLYTFFRPKKK